MIMIRTVNNQIADLFFEEELRKAHLFEMWEWVVLHNPGKYNPYHNTQHMYHMAILALKLLRAEEEFQAKSLLEQKMDELICLLTCLWHDYGHTAGKQDDAGNIRVATNAFINWWESFGRDHQYLHMCGKLPPGSSKIVMSTLHVTDHVTKAIRCTEFPFKYAPFSVVECAVRDADLLYTFSDSTGTIVYGLFKELHYCLPAGMSFKDFLGAQTKFHEGVTLYTHMGQRIHKHLTSFVINEQHRWAQEHEPALGK